MANITPLNGRRPSIVNRRRFLAASGVGISGLIILKQPLATAEAAITSSLDGAAIRLATAVGSQTLADNINEYIRRRDVPAATRSEVSRMNTMMAQDQLRFTDLSAATVYSPNGYYFFYSARSQDRVNTCLAFFDVRRPEGQQHIAFIEGPTLFGISNVAEEIAQNLSHAAAGALILPVHVISRGTGCWCKSYSQPDTYEASEAAVEGDYRVYPDGRHNISVKVLAEGGKYLERNYA